MLEAASAFGPCVKVRENAKLRSPGRAGEAVRIIAADLGAELDLVIAGGMAEAQQDQTFEF